MKALASDADRQRVTVLLQTGLRKSEFLGLRWKDSARTKRAQPSELASLLLDGTSG